MRYLRRNVLNPKSQTDSSIAVSISGEIIFGTPYSLTLPRGVTADRSPDTTAPTYTEGMIRYNTSTHEVEVYQGDEGLGEAKWRSLRYKESTGITQQSLGIGDGSTVIFGPLNPAPPSQVESGTTWGGQNIIVLVENVFQLHTTNYTIVQNPPGGYMAGYYLQFTSAVPALKPVTVLQGFDK